jgi:hypothetical protein
MVIQSDGAIYPSGDPSSETNTYGGLVLTNKDNSAGLYISPPTDVPFTPTPTGTIGINGRLIFNNTSSLSEGTFDNNTGGNNGISLICGIGYELNWQGGHLTNTADNGLSFSNIYCDSALEFPGSGIDNVEISSTGIVFADGSSQSTAGIVSNTGLVTSSLQITNIVSIAQADYDALPSKDTSTLYIISG